MFNHNLRGATHDTPLFGGWYVASRAALRSLLLCLAVTSVAVMSVLAGGTPVLAQVTCAPGPDPNDLNVISFSSDEFYSGGLHSLWGVVLDQNYGVVGECQTDDNYSLMNLSFLPQSHSDRLSIDVVQRAGVPGRGPLPTTNIVVTNYDNSLIETSSNGAPYSLRGDIPTSFDTDPSATATIIITQTNTNNEVYTIVLNGVRKDDGVDLMTIGQATFYGPGLGDAPLPDSYAASFDQSPINSINESAASFSLSDAELGATYDYEITSSNGGTPVTGSGVVTSPSQTISGIDLSGLPDGTISLSVTLTGAGGTGSAATDSVLKDSTAPTVDSITASPNPVTVPGSTIDVVVKFSESMDTSQTPTLSFSPDASSALQNLVTQTGTWSSDTNPNDTYTVTYTVQNVTIAIDDIDVTVSTAFQDANNNPLDSDHTVDDVFSINLVIDTTAPMVDTVVPSVSQLVSGTNQFSIVVTFSEPMDTNLTPTLSFSEDISAVLPNATTATGSWTSSTTYEVTYTTINDVGANISDIDVFISTSFEDAAGNPLDSQYTATDVFSILQDNIPPTLTITADAEVRGPFAATFTFSENVTGFALADITVGNGTASDFAGTDDVYTAIITPTEHGTVTLDVAAAVAIDGAGNDNTAADQVSVNYIDENYVRQRTQRIVSNFMTRRGDAIVSNQPDFTERLNQAGPGSSGAGASFSGEGGYANNRMNLATSLRQMLAANKANKDQRIAGLRASRGAGQEGGQEAGQENGQQGGQEDGLGNGLKIGQQGGGTQSLGFRNLSANDGAPAGFDLWIRGRWARYENDTNQGDVGLLFIGADYKFNNNFVLGVVAQFDWTDEVDDTDDFKINGRGWMVGPYLVAQLHQNLIFDANFSWGQSDNEVSPFNTYTDSFDGTRWLASAKFTGSFTFGSLHVAPHIGVLYFQERQEAYIDSLSIDIPSQTVKLGRLSFGPKISTTIERKDGTTISPYLGLKGLWDFERSAIVDLTTGLASESTDDVRARVDAGVRIRLPDGLTLNGEGFYDGLGAKDYKSYGGSIRINIPLQRDGSPAETMKLGAKQNAGDAGLAGQRARAD